MPAAIGIDLGTTNSCCAVLEGGKAIVIPNQEGTRTTPSVIAIQAGPKFIVGHAAKRQLLVDPKGTVSAVKRLIGRSFFSETVQQARSVYPYAIVEGQGRDAYIQVGEDKFSAPELSSKVLGKLKEAAEQHLGEMVAKAVVTVPAYFDDRQRQATRDAGEIAGLDVIRIINEPTAAALAFGLNRQDAGTVAVFDLGGGTFDVSILEIKKGVFHVKSTCGDTFLGGEDFDQEIVKHFLAVCESKLQSRLPREPFVLQRVREAAENAKHALSYEHEALVSIPFLATGGGKSHSVQFRFTRAELERLVEPLVQRLAPFCEKAMEDAQLTPDRVEAVLLVGGMTRMPAVRKLAERVFHKSPKTEVNPDEAVAIGAAIQAGILTGVLEKVLLLDVTPLSLGIETGGGIFTKVVDRNTTVPVKRSKVFTTAYDRQPMVEVHILQGERDMAQDNLSLGKFQLVGLPPAPRGVPQIDVLFEINADGILKVSAKDLGTGTEQAIRVEGYGGLTREQIEKLKADAAEHQLEDLKRREAAEMRLNAEGILYSANRMLSEYGTAMDGNKGDDMRSLVRDLEAALTGDDLKKIQDISHALTALVNACATGLYEAEAT